MVDPQAQLMIVHHAVDRMARHGSTARKRIHLKDSSHDVTCHLVLIVYPSTQTNIAVLAINEYCIGAL